MIPWYTTPEALEIIRRIRANPPEVVCHHRDYFLTRDEWQQYVGDDVEVLCEVWNRAVGITYNRDVLRDDPQDVIAATLGERLVGIHNTIDDHWRLARIAVDLRDADVQEAA